MTVHVYQPNRISFHSVQTKLLPAGNTMSFADFYLRSVVLGSWYAPDT